MMTTIAIQIKSNQIKCGLFIINHYEHRYQGWFWFFIMMKGGWKHSACGPQHLLTHLILAVQGCG
jgi:hypothetical protein